MRSKLLLLLYTIVLILFKQSNAQCMVKNDVGNFQIINGNPNLCIYRNNMKYKFTRFCNYSVSDEAIWDIACRSSGYVGLDTLPTTATSNNNKSNIINVTCSGNETSLGDCEVSYEKLSLTNSSCYRAKRIICEKCSNHSQCGQNRKCSDGICECVEQLMGRNCDQCNQSYIGDNAFCMHGGVCTENGTCNCSAPYAGTNCNVAINSIQPVTVITKTSKTLSSTKTISTITDATSPNITTANTLPSTSSNQATTTTTTPTTTPTTTATVTTTTTPPTTAATTTTTPTTQTPTTPTPTTPTPTTVTVTTTTTPTTTTATTVTVTTTTTTPTTPTPTTVIVTTTTTPPTASSKITTTPTTTATKTTTMTTTTATTATTSTTASTTTTPTTVAATTTTPTKTTATTTPTKTTTPTTATKTTTTTATTTIQTTTTARPTKTAPTKTKTTATTATARPTKTTATKTTTTTATTATTSTSTTTTPTTTTTAPTMTTTTAPKTTTSPITPTITMTGSTTPITTSNSIPSTRNNQATMTINYISTNSKNTTGPPNLAKFETNSLKQDAIYAVIVVLFISILIVLIIATIIITLLLVKRNRRNKIVQKNSRRFLEPITLSPICSTVTTTSEQMYETINSNNIGNLAQIEIFTNPFNEINNNAISNCKARHETEFHSNNPFVNNYDASEEPYAEINTNELFNAFISTTPLNSYSYSYSNPMCNCSSTANANYNNNSSFKSNNYYKHSSNNDNINNEMIYWEPKDTVNQILFQMSENQFREISRDSIIFVKKLGSGEFGEVFNAQWNYELESSIPVAVKILKNNSTQALQTAFMKEAAIMGQFDHPNIIKLLGVVSQSQPYMIVTELMETQLLQFISSALNNLPTIKMPKVQRHVSAILLKFTREIASGLRYLSSKQFIHRDLAARNILIGKDLVCRISDFGMSRELRQESDYYKSQGGIIPVRWCSPEAVFYKRYSEKSDVWSYGMTLYEMWTLGKKPWHSYSSNEEVLRAIETKEILSPPAGCPRAIYSIMVDTWNPNPEARVDFEYLVNALSGEEAELLQNNNPNTTTDDANTGGNEEECYLIGGDPNTALSMYRDVQLIYSIP